MKKIILLSICGCLLSSCSLDLQPENGLTYSNSFNNEKELNATTTSINTSSIQSSATTMFLRQPA